jgi:hypothetical protein
LPPTLCAAFEHPFQSVSAATSDFIVFAAIGAISFLTPPRFAARRNVTHRPAIAPVQLIATGGANRAVGGAERDPLIGHNLGDLDVGIDLSSTGPGDDLTVRGPDAHDLVLIISIMPPSDCVSFSAFASNAKTSPTGRAMVTVFDSSGIDVSRCGEVIELV